MKKGTVLLDKLIESKVIMYEHYYRLKKVFANEMIHIYTDTDSLKTYIIGKLYTQK